MAFRFGLSAYGQRLMQVTVHSSKLLTALLAALMVWPSWAVRDCCCTRRAALAETAACCQPSATEAANRLPPCCAARAKATSKQPTRCQVTSTCRCRFALAAIALPVSVKTPRAVIVGGTDWAETPNHAAELRSLSSTAVRPFLRRSPGFDGPSEVCVRLCRWLT